MATLISKGQELGKKLVVTGCVPQGDKGATELQGLSLLGKQLVQALPTMASQAFSKLQLAALLACRGSQLQCRGVSDRQGGRGSGRDFEG